MKRITSRQNPIVKLARDLARPRRAGDTRVLLDGAHLVEDAIAAGLRLQIAAASDDFIDTATGARLIAAAAAAGAETVVVSAAVLGAMSPTKTPSGVLAIADAAPASLDDAFAAAPALVLAAVGVQDPGNAGAIVRAADAAGASAVVFCGPSADPFGWKALRGSMGSAFRLPVALRVPADRLLHAAGARGIRRWATAPRGGTSLFDADLTAPCCLLLGGEGAGLDQGLVDRADGRLTIPMRPGVESLNVAVAAALFAYEAARQRAGAARPRHAGPAARGARRRRGRA